MKDNADDIMKARELLARYYDGCSTVGQQQWLADFFKNTDADTLPEDMAVDAALFGMAAQEAERLSGDAPADLESRIRASIGLPEKSASRQKNLRMPRYLRIALTAAAAVALLIVVTNHDKQQRGDSFTASIEGLEVDKRVEVTDPVQAERIKAEAFAMLSEKLAIAHRPMKKADDKIKHMNQTIKKVLSDEKI